MKKQCWRPQQNPPTISEASMYNDGLFIMNRLEERYGHESFRFGHGADRRPLSSFHATVTAIKHASEVKEEPFTPQSRHRPSENHEAFSRLERNVPNLQPVSRDLTETETFQVVHHITNIEDGIDKLAANVNEVSDPLCDRNYQLDFENMFCNEKRSFQSSCLFETQRLGQKRISSSNCFSGNLNLLFQTVPKPREIVLKRSLQEFVTAKKIKSSLSGQSKWASYHEIDLRTDSIWQPCPQEPRLSPFLKANATGQKKARARDSFAFSRKSSNFAQSPNALACAVVANETIVVEQQEREIYSSETGRKQNMLGPIDNVRSSSGCQEQDSQCNGAQENPLFEAQSADRSLTLTSVGAESLASSGHENTPTSKDSRCDYSRSVCFSKDASGLRSIRDKAVKQRDSRDIGASAEMSSACRIQGMLNTFPGRAGEKEFEEHILAVECDAVSPVAEAVKHQKLSLIIDIADLSDNERSRLLYQLAKDRHCCCLVLYGDNTTNINAGLLKQKTQEAKGIVLHSNEETYLFPLDSKSNVLEWTRLALNRVVKNGKMVKVAINSKHLVTALLQDFSVGNHRDVSGWKFEDPYIAGWLLRPDNPPHTLQELSAMTGLDSHFVRAHTLTPFLQYRQQLLEID